MEPNTFKHSIWVPEVKSEKIYETYYSGYPRSGNFQERTSIIRYLLPGAIPHCKYAIKNGNELGTILISHDHESGCVLWYPYRGTTYSKVRGKITNEMGYDETAAFLTTLHYHARLEMISKKEFVAIPPHTDEPLIGPIEDPNPTLEELFG